MSRSDRALRWVARAARRAADLAERAVREPAPPPRPRRPATPEDWAAHVAARTGPPADWLARIERAGLDPTEWMPTPRETTTTAEDTPAERVASRLAAEVPAGWVDRAADLVLAVARGLEAANGRGEASARPRDVPPPRVPARGPPRRAAPATPSGRPSEPPRGLPSRAAPAQRTSRGDPRRSDAPLADAGWAHRDDGARAPSPTHGRGAAALADAPHARAPENSNERRSPDIADARRGPQPAPGPNVAPPRAAPERSGGGAPSAPRSPRSPPSACATAPTPLDAEATRRRDHASSPVREGRSDARPRGEDRSDHRARFGSEPGPVPTRVAEPVRRSPVEPVAAGARSPVASPLEPTVTSTSVPGTSGARPPGPRTRDARPPVARPPGAPTPVVEAVCALPTDDTMRGLDTSAARRERAAPLDLSGAAAPWPSLPSEGARDGATDAGWLPLRDAAPEPDATLTRLEARTNDAARRREQEGRAWSG